MNPADTREAFDLAMADSTAILDAVRELEAPDGETWDADRITDDREFIAFYLDLQNRPYPSPFSIMDYLPDVAPEVFKSLTTRYERALRKMGA